MCLCVRNRASESVWEYVFSMHVQIQGIYHLYTICHFRLIREVYIIPCLTHGPFRRTLQQEAGDDLIN